jgi:hypothetical protein
MRFVAFTGTVAALALALPAAADVIVANPGPIVWTLGEGSTIGINTQAPFAIGGKDSSFAGSVADDGTIVFPAAGMKLAPSSVTFSGITFTVSLTPVGDGAGTLDPATGVVTARATFAVAIKGSLPFFPAKCRIPNLTIDASTATSGGVGYDSATGNAVLVDDRLAVPAAVDCGLYTSTINKQLALPSAAGSNLLTLVVHVDPTVEAPPVVEPTPAEPTP